jgi:anaerobic selenocysteine-containing dehydrogenase
MIHSRTCSFCEATCGLSIELEDGRVTHVSGDAADVYSHGYLCSKGASIAQLHEDPDRLREPLVREPGGQLEPVSWDAAFAEVDRRLAPIIAEHGTNAIAVYVGNPSGHDLAATLYHRILHRASGGRRLFTVGTVDQLPKSLSCALMFGSQFIVPVPDLDRSTYVLMLGANPAVSNGSLLVAPDLRGRMRALLARGGKLVVIDPRRTRSAREASEHHFIRPGADAALLAALVQVLFEEGLVALGHGAEHVNGAETVKQLTARFTPERVAGACGIAPDSIRRIARELAGAERPVVYGRTGTTTQAFGTMASWLIDVLNVLIGALDSPGGAMFGTPAADGPTSAPTGRGRGVTLGRWRSLAGHPEVLGELPVAALAGEILSPDPRRARALVTLAGNPALSTPDGPALETALERLEAMVSHDLYLNETTRHADVLLPAASPLQRPHYPLGIYPNALRNLANFSPAVLEADADRPADWEIVLRLTGIFAGHGPDVDVAELDRQTMQRAVQRRIADPQSAIAGREPGEIMAALEPRVGPERMLDLQLRCGPYGDHFGVASDGLTLDQLLHAEHGIDYGPLTPRLPGILRTPSGKVELAPEPLLGEPDRLEAALGGLAERGLLMIGRRDNRSMNSWLHNLPNLSRGAGRCTLMMHPDDAARTGLAAGQQVRVRSEAGTLELPLELTDDLMPGVVSAPHGWGHEDRETRQHLAVATQGVNVNRLIDRTLLEPLSGASVLNGFAVTVESAGP